ncbi:MAG: hypothetical protein Q6373_003370 [Candidatus Sigynarchaeota archaeon]
MGTLFFLADKYNPELKVDPSFIGGICTAYFFFVVLPEISSDLPRLFIDLPFLQYTFIIVGLAFTHVTECYIVQKVNVKTRKTALELTDKEKALEEMKENLVDNLMSLLDKGIDKFTIANISDVLTSVREQEQVVKAQIDMTRHAVEHEVGKHLMELHEFTNICYHFIIGATLFSILLVDVVVGVIFFIFALIMALSSHVNNHMRLYFGMDVDIELNNKHTKTTYALAAPVGIVFSIVFEVLFGIHLRIMYYLFSFISGSLLYIIVRNIIPSDDQGKPKRFLAGLVVFVVIVVIISLASNSF